MRFLRLHFRQQNQAPVRMSKTATTGPMAIPAKAPTVRLVVGPDCDGVCEEVAAEEEEAAGCDIETGGALG